MSAPAPNHYAYLYGTFMIVKDMVPNTTKPNQHLLEMQLPLITCGQKHPVSGYGYMTDVPVVNEMVGLWASVGHDGSARTKLELYITSVERFPWKDTEDVDYLDFVPHGKQPMLIMQGAVETDTVDHTFVMSGMNWGNGKNNVFRFKVIVPPTTRWANVPMPTQGQVVVVRGEVNRREPEGLYTLELVDLRLPGRVAPVTPQSTPRKRPAGGVTPVRRPVTRAAPTVTRLEDPEPHPESLLEGAPSGSASA